LIFVVVVALLLFFFFLMVVVVVVVVDVPIMKITSNVLSTFYYKEWFLYR